jgi:hypothetical protein
MKFAYGFSRTRRLIIVSPLIGLVPSLAFGQQSSASTWLIEGRRIGVDNCPIGCPCLFGEAPMNGICQNLTIYHVDRGHYRGVDLGNTKFAIAGEFARANRNDKASHTFNSYYLDANAAPSQIAALRAILGTAFASRGKPAEVKELPIEVGNLDGYGMVGETCWGTVGKIAALEVTTRASPNSADPAKPLIIQNPANHPFARLVYLGRSSNSQYESAGKLFRFHDTAGESMDFHFEGA